VRMFRKDPCEKLDESERAEACPRPDASLRPPQPSGRERDRSQRKEGSEVQPAEYLDDAAQLDLSPRWYSGSRLCPGGLGCRLARSDPVRSVRDRLDDLD
jgi:hypothetical protein